MFTTGRGARQAHGATLAEMLLAVAVLAIIGTLALPRANVTAEYTRSASVMEVVQALRYAQSEAQRTGVYKVVSCDPARQQLRIFSLLAGSSAENTAVPVLHPLVKTQYLVNLGTNSAMSNTTLASCTFTFADGTKASQVAFGADGAPVSLTDPKGVNPIALSASTISIAGGAGASTVQVDPLTGRVSVTP